MSAYSFIKSDVIGRWPDIFANLGIAVGDGRHVNCPICYKPGDRPHFRFDDLGGEGTYICTCSVGDGWTLIQKKFNLEFSEAVSEVERIISKCEIKTASVKSKASPENLRSAFLNSRPIAPGDPAWKYLQSRHLDPRHFPATLRYSEKLWEIETKKQQKGMIAVFTGPDGQGVTIQQTFLDDEGKKLDIQEPKKLMPALKKMSGGAVRLFPPDNRLAIGEGIETMLAVRQQTGIPAWAALTSSLLQGFEPPDDLAHLYIFGDNDKSFGGQAAAFSLAHRVSTTPRYKEMLVSVYIPDKQGLDWLDILVLETTKKIFNEAKII